MVDDFPTQLKTKMLHTNQTALSWRDRMAHVVLLLLAIGMGIVLIALLVTEPDLPMRTIAAFSVMLLIAIGWTIFATWVLARRHPLYSRHKVVAGWMATAFSLVFTTSSFIAAWLGGGSAFTITAGAGTIVVVAATAFLFLAKRQFRKLKSQRLSLTRELDRRAT